MLVIAILHFYKGYFLPSLFMLVENKPLRLMTSYMFLAIIIKLYVKPPISISFKKTNDGHTSYTHHPHTLFHQWPRFSTQL